MSYFFMTYGSLTHPLIYCTLTGNELFSYHRNAATTHTHTQTFAFKHIFVSYVHHRQGRYKSLSILIAPRR